MASPYREAEQKYGDDEDGFYEYLRQHRLDDPSLCVGFYLKRAARELNRNQSDVAAFTESSSAPPVTRGFISQMLTGHTKATPSTYTRLARAMDANPVEFFLAEGWLDTGDLLAYHLPYATDWTPVAKKLADIPALRRPAVIEVVSAVLDTLSANLK